MTELSNLEQIKKGFAYGWSATFIFEDRHYHVVNILNGSVIITETGRIINSMWLRSVGFKITGYLYGADLCGNEPIPEGQKFRVKETGEIKTYKIKINDGKIRIYFEDGEERFNKSEIEPVF